MRRGAFLAYLSAAVSLAAGVAAAALLLLSGATGSDGGDQAPAFVWVVSVVATTAVGLVVALRRPANPIGWIFSAYAVVLAINFAGIGYATYGIVGHPGSLPGAGWVAWFVNWSGRSTGGFMLLAFFLFPDGRLLSPRWRAALILPPVVAIGFAARAFVPGPMDFLGLENPAGVAWVPRDVDDGSLGGVPLLLGTVLAIVSVGLRFRRAGGQERDQIKWLALPIILLLVALAGTVLTLMAPDLAPATEPVGELFYAGVQLLIPISMAIAIVRYRLYDIDVLINRALVYGATTAVIAIAFFAGIVVLQALLRPLTSGSELAVAASTLVSFALFQPLRRRVQLGVDRRFYRSRYDAARILDAFSSRLRAEVDLETVRADLVDAVRRTVQPAHASVWLR